MPKKPKRNLFQTHKYPNNHISFIAGFCFGVLVSAIESFRNVSETMEFALVSIFFFLSVFVFTMGIGNLFNNKYDRSGMVVHFTKKNFKLMIPIWIRMAFWFIGTFCGTITFKAVQFFQ